MGLAHMEPIKDVSDVLFYLKTVLEGKNNVHLNIWLKKHANELSTLLQRSEYLKLKFNPIDFARRKLVESAVEFIENSSLVKYEQYLMTFSDEALTDDGEIKSNWFGKVFNGVLKSLLQGDRSGFAEAMEKYLKKNQGDLPILSENTTDLLYFAESTLNHNKEISIAIMVEIAAYFSKRGIVVVEIENLKKTLGIVI